MRLKVRHLSILDRSYLHFRYLWRNLETAVNEAKANLPAESRVVLDIGCGQKPYADLFHDMQHIGLNYDAHDASPDMIGDAMKLPVASQVIDLVFCTQVLEHVPDSRRLVEECFRVLRPGGWLVMSAPFYWPLHEEPYDYCRFTRYGLERMLKDAGFSSSSVREDGGDYARFFLSVIQILPRWIGAPLRIPLNVCGAALDKFFYRTTLPANYTVLARAGMAEKA